MEEGFFACYLLILSIPLSNFLCSSFFLLLYLFKPLLYNPSFPVLLLFEFYFFLEFLLFFPHSFFFFTNSSILLFHMFHLLLFLFHPFNKVESLLFRKFQTLSGLFLLTFAHNSQSLLQLLILSMILYQLTST